MHLHEPNDGMASGITNDLTAVLKQRISQMCTLKRDCTLAYNDYKGQRLRLIIYTRQFFRVAYGFFKSDKSFLCT